MSTEFTSYIMAAVMIFIGTAIDYLIIAHLYKKDKYKGFPATVIPFICVAIWYGVLYFGLSLDALAILAGVLWG